MAESLTTNIEQQFSQLNLNQQSASREISAAASLQQPTITWRQTVTPDLRIHLTDKLLQVLCDQSQCDQQQKHRFVELAKQIENEAFEAANSRAEYYHLIPIKIYEIQKKRCTNEQFWRESVAIELRKQIAKKLAQTIIPGCDLESVDEQNSMRNLLDYAQKVECDIFQMASSRSGYYKLIGEKIYNIQQGLDEQLSDDCSSCEYCME